MAEQTDIQEMVREVRSELGEPGNAPNPFFENDEIVRWLNYAVKLFARKTRILKTKVTYAWPANTDSVALTTVLPAVNVTQHDPKIDMVEFHTATYGVHILRASKREVILNEPNRPVTSEKGAPSKFFYSPWEDTCGFTPTPDVAGTLAVYYYYEPAKMDYNANTPLDANLSRWWEDICAYGIYRGKLKDVDHFAPQEAQESLGRFSGAINMCRAELGVQDGPDIIEFVDDYPAPY
jgi:hypothetical protein